MSLFLIPFFMSAALAQDAAPPAPPIAPATPAAPSASDAEAKAALVAACAKLANAKSYAFELKSESTGGGFGRGGDGGSGGGESGGGPRVATPITAEFQSGLPMHLVQGETDAYLHEGKLVHKNRDGVWTIYDREAMRNRGGPSGGAGDGAGRGATGGEGGSGAQGGAASGGQAGAGGADATGGAGGSAAGSDKAGAGAAGEKAAGGETAAQDGNRGGRSGGRGSRGSLGTLQSVLTPQALVKDVDSKVADVVREERDGKVVFKGKLSESAALALTSFGRGGRGSRDGGDGGGPERKASGLFEIVVAPDGAIESILLDTDTTMEFGDRSVDMKRKSTYSISNVDHVEVKVPDEAMTHFEV